MADKPYKDADKLRELYHGEGLSSREVAERMGCGKKTILRWLDNHGIEKAPQKKTVDDKRLYDYEWLEEQYVSQKRSSREIADELDCSKKAVLRHLDRADVSRRDTSEATSLGMDKGRCGFHTNNSGYEKATTREGDRVHAIGIHRLVAIADGANPYKVFSGYEYHTHHKNEIPWDNRAENLEVVSASEHRLRHNE